jgi:GDP-4-dehydro-6-deoxy-D-mannose reductase
VRALVTGADGFAGRHLARHLADCGDEVVAVDRECNVTIAGQVERVLREHQPDAIYHLAALSHVGDSWNNRIEFVRVNVFGTRNVIECAYKAVPNASILFVSSADVYGIVSEEDLPIRETHEAMPANPYAQSKLQAELLAQSIASANTQRLVIVRPFNHIGPGQSDKFVVPALASRLLDAAERGATEIAVGNLSTRRDFSDVRDVVRAYRLLMERGHDGEIYNVASGRDSSLTDIANELVAEIAPDVKLKPDEGLLRPVDVPVMRGSYEKTHKATGWEPSISLATSLHDVVGELRSRRRSLSA